MIKRILVVLLFVSAFTSVEASISVKGTLSAEKSCPAYLSKNKKTNPEDRSIESGKRYAILEINRASNPDWYRIDMANGKNPLRWVYRDCGQIDLETQTPRHCNMEPGNADSNVLALSWQPAFCETYGYEAGKEECRKLKPTSFSQQHLVLHGLWPNQKACGYGYGFCGVQERRRHCDYEALNFESNVDRALSLYMPSYASGSCLERHEWNKHGSCQLQTINTYFSLAIRLAEDMNNTDFADIIRKYRGGQVSLSKLEHAIERSFGTESKEKIYLGCNQGKLVDVYIQLPAVIYEDAVLSDLVQNAPGKKTKNGCPAMVQISDFYAVNAYH